MLSRPCWRQYVKTMPTDSLHICLVVPLPPPRGGITNWADMVCSHIRNRSDVKLSVVDTSPRWRDVADVSLVKRSLGGLIQMVRDLLRLWKLVRVHQPPAVVHLTTSAQLSLVRDYAVSVLCRLYGTHLVYHLHFGRTPEMAARNTIEWRLLRKIVSRTASVIAIDEATTSVLAQAIPACSVSCIANGFDPARIPPPAATAATRTVLYLGHIIPSKGIEDLLQAWMFLRTGQSDAWTLVLAGGGQGTYRETLKIRFPDPSLLLLPEQSHDDALRLIQFAAICVLPSHTEGFPLVVLEAMALARPVIATTVGAIPQMLSDGCGILIPPRDVPALAGALHSLMTDPAKRAALAQKALRRAQAEYSINAVYQRYLAVWRRAAGIDHVGTMITS